MTDTLAVKARAKLNLFLRVLAREVSGYHTIETLFTLVDLADHLTVERIGRGVELDVEGPDTGPAAENLAVRAARMVLEATGNRFGVRLRLIKRIPVQAGLGGGSSDAAAALAAVNALADHAVPQHELLQFAARLGSDVAFFASGASLALAWGRGERLYRLPGLPAAPVLLAIPPLGVPTPEAYAALDAGRTDAGTRGAVVLNEAAFESWGSIARLGGNDFEGILFARAPRARDLFERLAGTGPLLVRLSGSGSAVAALYRNNEDRDQAAVVLGERDQVVIRTTTASPA